MNNPIARAGFYEHLLWILRQRKRYRVTGNSMTPALKHGDEVFVDTCCYRSTRPKIGDIVVAYHPYQTDIKLVKRIAGVDTDGQCHLIGDNPEESTDSRSYGRIPLERIIGRVVSC